MVQNPGKSMRSKGSWCAKVLSVPLCAVMLLRHLLTDNFEVRDRIVALLFKFVKKAAILNSAIFGFPSLR